MKWKTFFIGISLWLAGPVLVAQRFEDWFSEMAQQRIDEQMDEEALWNHYFQLWEKGLDLSGADRFTLESSRLLTGFQIESLLAYRKTYGRIGSAAELQWIDGFSQEWIVRHTPFLRFTGGSQEPVRSHWRHKLLLRSGWNLDEQPASYLGPPFSLLLKYQVCKPGAFEAGLLLEQDSGEPWMLRQGYLQSGFPDFIAGYLAWEHISLGSKKRWEIQQLVFGNFQLRLGQGLVMWKGTSVGDKSSPGQLLRRSDPLVPSRSSDEQQSLFGLAVTAGYERWSLTVGLSSRRLDAKVREGRFYSLPEGGYHRTLTEQQQRKTLSQQVVGCSLGYRTHQWYVGTHAAFTSYDLQDGRVFTDYRARTAYQGGWYNWALEGRWAWSSLQFYGELARDRRGAVAALLGGEWAPVYAWELALQLRYYAPEYTAPHAGAWAVGSLCSNEHSVTGRALWRWGGQGSCSLHAMWAYHPASRYRVPKSSSEFELQSQVAWEGTVWQWQARAQWVEDPAYALPRKSVRLQGGWRSSGTSSVQYFTKLQYGLVWSKDCGRALSVQLGLRSRSHTQSSRAWEWSGSMVVYRADAWEDRLYLYQRSLPGVFSFPALYGRGVDLSMYFNYQPRSNLSLGGTLSRTGLRVQLQWDIKPS